MQMCRAISEYGLSLLKDGDGILTHCNAGPLATSRYGNVDVTGVVRRGNVYGTQFHPEKSGDTGLRLLRAFAEL